MENSSCSPFTPWDPDREKIRILFIASYPIIWAQYGARLYEGFASHPQFSPLVLFAPAFFMGCRPNNLGFADSLRELLISGGTPFVPGRSYDLRRHRPHVVMIPQPYPSQLPQNFDLETLAAVGARPAYLPYGVSLMSSTLARDTEVHQPLIIGAWRVFLRSKMQQDYFGRYCPSGNAHTVVTGHPKYDAYADPPPPRRDILDKAAGRRIVLLNLGHVISSGPNVRQYSMCDLLGPAIMENVAKRDDLLVVLRLHALAGSVLMKSLGPGVDSFSQWKNEIQACPYLFLDESSDMMPTFMTADALISDISSLLLEFMPTGKPILYLVPPNPAPLLKSLASFEAGLYKAHNWSEVDAFLNMLIEGEDPLRSQRLLDNEYYMHKMDGQAVRRIVEAVLDGMMGGDDFAPALPMAHNPEDPAEEYWSAARSATENDPAFHHWKGETIGSILDEHGPFHWVLDLGCGDGRYTELLARNALGAEGWDRNEAFLKEAARRAANNGLTNIIYKPFYNHKDAPLYKTPHYMQADGNRHYDLIACLDFTSCFFGNHDLITILDQLELLADEGSCLLIGDSFSKSQDFVLPRLASLLPQHLWPPALEPLHETVLRYRNLDDVLGALRRRGFRLVDKYVRQPGDTLLFDALALLKYDSPAKDGHSSQAVAEP